MQVGLVTGQRSISLVDMPDPTPSTGKAVVDISYCGICGTDLHAFLSGEPYNPAICGHEWVGNVSAMASADSNRHVKEGDRVAIGVAAACGQCGSCRRGDASHCESAFAGAIGMHPLAAPHGGFASAIAFDIERLYGVAPSLSDEQAAILEPVTVAVHAVRRTPMRLGDSCIIIGAGPIGLLVMQAARAAGAGKVCVLEPASSRGQIASQLGADHVLDPTAYADSAALNAALAELLGSAGGADVVFECAGIPQTIQTAVDLCRRGGTISLVGVPALPAQIDAASWLIKEIHLATSIAYLHEEFELAQALVVDGRIDASALHTGTVVLDAMQDAFVRLAENPTEVKILVDPRG
ncbi:MAG: zinc-dependent alcohol dehydrogenase [Pseudomonadales bacterium]